MEILTSITPQQWETFEQWFNFQIIMIWVVFGVFFIFVGLVPLLYHRNKITWILLGGLTVIGLGLGVYSYIKSNQPAAKKYIVESHYITPQTRAYSIKTSAWSRPFDDNEISQYRYVSDIENPSKLTSVYSKKKVRQNIDFLGRDGGYIYVSLDGVVMKFSEFDCRKTKGDQAYFEGYKFDMKNDSFEKMGFFSLPYKMRDKVVIPTSEWDKQVPENYKRNYSRPGEVAGWLPSSNK